MLQKSDSLLKIFSLMFLKSKYQIAEEYFHLPIPYFSIIIKTSRYYPLFHTQYAPTFEVSTRVRCLSLLYKIHDIVYVSKSKVKIET